MSVEIVTAEEFAQLVERVAELEARLAAPPEPSEWMTVSDAATYIGRSEEATYKLVTRLGLKHQEVPRGRIQIRRSELDTALNTNKPT